MEENNIHTMTKDEQTWGMLCHLSALAAFIIPLGNIFGPLIVWLIKKDQYPFVDEQGKQSLNFQISYLIYWAASIGLIVWGALEEIWVFLVVGIVAFIVVMIASFILFIVASVKANNGEHYRYPFIINFLS